MRTTLRKMSLESIASVLVALAAGTVLSVTMAATGTAAEPREPRGNEQRYEVTIAPPRRPGSNAVQASGENQSTTGAAGDQHRDGAAGAGTDTPQTSSQPAAASASGRAEDPTVTETDGPRLALQVGAFRLRPSAEKLRDTLAASFRDVIIIDTTSGGEPLYRVRVGSLPKGPALDDIKRRLLAAGYPAFEVAATQAQRP